MSWWGIGCAGADQLANIDKIDNQNVGYGLSEGTLVEVCNNRYYLNNKHGHHYIWHQQFDAVGTGRLLFVTRKDVYHDKKLMFCFPDWNDLESDRPYDNIPIWLESD